MKNKYFLIAALAAIPLLNPAQALADRGHRDGESFYYGLSKDGYRVVISYGDNDRRDHRYYRDRRPVKVVTYKRPVYRDVHYYKPRGHWKHDRHDRHYKHKGHGNHNHKHRSKHRGHGHRGHH